MKRVLAQGQLVDNKFYLVAEDDGQLKACTWSHKNGVFIVGDYSDDIKFDNAFLVLEVD
ncbi:hypothetical protein A0118_RS02615 [Acinetobacter baumannii]|uniref:hypothetical protein n=1 Tax=Acinetobacter baumannii TaxID=470 RepID=UPI00135A12D9|nr:hypothetical protein [Acinetobacter baumannii]EHU1613561.1 hypothetical protein [Acinetobacter baumannii]EHU2312243.1 hypothetical protein [Acinetobacter baumannii]EHU2314569.1 hypothetical protein [Acinetobacter baumannii]EHU2483007.1 hypothetical protein [Acinetobacter baumannii]EHU2486455.1 hypothetical protein [Acinetobacter baumannii]